MAKLRYYQCTYRLFFHTPTLIDASLKFINALIVFYVRVTTQICCTHPFKDDFLHRMTYSTIQSCLTKFSKWDGLGSTCVDRNSAYVFYYGISDTLVTLLDEKHLCIVLNLQILYRYDLI